MNPVKNYQTCKEAENMTRNCDKNQALEERKMIHMIKLADKNIKAVIITILLRSEQ